MRRRDLVAGIGSLGVLAGAGTALSSGVPSFADEDEGDDGDDDSSDGPAEIETIDASGSDAGTVAVPGDRPTVATFFVTSCGYCQSQVAPFGEARERIDERYGPDAARFLGVNYLNADQEPADELREWWETHGGNATVGYQSSAGLASRYGVITYPVTIVVDADGERRWKSDVEVQSAGDIVAALEPILEERDDGTTGADDGTNETSSGADEGSESANESADEGG